MCIEKSEYPDPFVSIIIPMRNEEKYIANCLASIMATNYPKNLLEIIVVDGMSTDKSRDIVETYACLNPIIRLIENPKKIIPAALNLGWKTAQGEIIIRMDAHALYDTYYILNCVRLLQATDAENVGGRQQPIGRKYIEKAIAMALSTRFGIGNAAYKFERDYAYVDTVYLGAWWRKTLEKLGGFNEGWLINEDYELNCRIRDAGGKILLSPKILSQYFVRGSLKELALQQFRYGLWRWKTIKEHPNSIRFRYIIPPIFVIVTILSFFTGIFFNKWGFIVLAFYLLTNFVFSIFLSLKIGLKYLFVLPVVYTIIHFAWGLGFIAGIFRWGTPKFSKRGFKNTLQ